MSEFTVQNIRVEEADILTCVHLSREIPEFVGPPEEEEYRRRLEGVPHLILVAYFGKRPIGFKVGYQREAYFYSWMGGVLPDFRRLRIAEKLAKRQEDWARVQGYDSITFKTRNQHKAMLIFALKNGFDIIGFREKESVTTNRILLRKAL
ncbi:MAG: GNAT family N-acetyltransferase [Saprospiraceae bacterium]